MGYERASLNQICVVENVAAVLYIHKCEQRLTIMFIIVKVESLVNTGVDHLISVVSKSTTS